MKYPTALPKPFDRTPSPGGIKPDEETKKLVDTQVDALLAQAPSFKSLSLSDQSNLRHRFSYIATYLAELLRDDWAQSEKIGQHPLIKRKVNILPHKNIPVASAMTADRDFQPGAVNQVARVTQETLQAIAFPTFVADLLRGSFQAIINSSIQQMEAFGELLENVSKSVDQFMTDNITDNQARDWLTQRYPNLISIKMEDEQPRLEPTPNADDYPMPDFRSELNTPESLSSLDETTLEETLLPAARRRLAQSRLQILSTLVMMGLQRIVVKHGRIRATMGFHIDASDRVHKEKATLFDTSTSISAAGQFMYFSASASTSITYVRSTKADSDSELNVNADLTGEVDLTFESDYMPLNRFASAEKIEQIRVNTPVPEHNQPTILSGGSSTAEGPSAASLLQTQIENKPQQSPPAPNAMLDQAGESPAASPPATPEQSPPAPNAMPDQAGESPAASPPAPPEQGPPVLNALLDQAGLSPPALLDGLLDQAAESPAAPPASQGLARL